MSLIETLRLAFTGLSSNRLRSALSMLGIIIGVASVVALLALGAAVRALVTAQLQGLGSNLLYVFPEEDDLAQRRHTAPELTNADLEAIGDRLYVPAVLAAAGEFSNNGIASAYGANYVGEIVGVTANYAALSKMELALGYFFDQHDIDTRARVAVLGFDVYQRLFQGEDPIGERLTINGLDFEVIGVVAERGLLRARADSKLFVPLSTAQLRLFPPAPDEVRRVELTAITVQVVDEASIGTALDQLTALLRERHKLSYQDNNFSVLTQEDLLASFGTITAALTIFLGAIASISLLVGGIGVMNVMLMSVTERTREIGLRKAVGARRSDILKQFLAESLVLSLMGGVAGIALGTLLSAAGGVFLQRVAVGLAVPVPLEAVLLATGTSLVVGLIFGLYPALRAAQLSPIEALRSE